MHHTLSLPLAVVRNVYPSDSPDSCPYCEVIHPLVRWTVSPSALLVRRVWEVPVPEPPFGRAEQSLSISVQVIQEMLTQLMELGRWIRGWSTFAEEFQRGIDVRAHVVHLDRAESTKPFFKLRPDTQVTCLWVLTSPFFFSGNVTQSSAIADGLPEMAGLSLTIPGATDQGALSPSPPRDDRVSPVAEIAAAPQTVVHLTVHANNSPVHIYGPGERGAGQGGGARTVVRHSPTDPQSPSHTCTLHSTHFPDEHIAPEQLGHAGKWWYAVTVGLRVGVRARWIDIAQYVTGAPGSCHQSFSTREEALGCYSSAKAAGYVRVIPSYSLLTVVSVMYCPASSVAGSVCNEECVEVPALKHFKGHRKDDTYA